MSDNKMNDLVQRCASFSISSSKKRTFEDFKEDMGDSFEDCYEQRLQKFPRQKRVHAGGLIQLPSTSNRREMVDMRINGREVIKEVSQEEEFEPLRSNLLGLKSDYDASKGVMSEGRKRVLEILKARTMTKQAEKTATLVSYDQ